MKNRGSGFSLRKIVRYLDDTYPDVGIDCPFFVVEVVVLSAAILQKTTVRDLSVFTGCTINFVDAIAKNMQNNALWVYGKYDSSTWLVNGIIVDDDRFCEHTMAGEGSFLFPGAKVSKTVDIFRFLWEQKCVPFWKSLIEDAHRPCTTRFIM